MTTPATDLIRQSAGTLAEAIAAGEVAALAAVARPRIGLVTNAGAEHLEGFGDLEGVARAVRHQVADDGVADEREVANRFLGLLDQAHDLAVPQLGHAEHLRIRHRRQQDLRHSDAVPRQRLLPRMGEADLPGRGGGLLLLG